jgi:hypothetical protein
MKSIEKAGTWSLVELPRGRKAIGSKWVFKIKRKSNGEIDLYKARLVAKGFSQKEGIDYIETFAPVVRMSSIRAIFAFAAKHDWHIHQMDVKCAYLNGDIDIELYMAQPIGFVQKGQEHLVCKLNKSLYGAKQSGRCWYKKSDSELRKLSFIPMESEPCIYIYNNNDIQFFLIVYVDDILLISNSLPYINKMKQELSKIFEMKDLGEAKYVIGIQIERDHEKGTISICQSEYVANILARFGMSDCHPVSTPLSISSKLTKSDCPSTPKEKLEMQRIPYQSAVGAIMYAMLCTRPDIAYAIVALSQFSSNPGQAHWIALKHLFRYLRGTIDYKITYSKHDAAADHNNSNQQQSIYGYCDADWGSDIDDRRSITGYCFMLANGAISWQSKKQPTVALSSTEAEYMAST